MNVNQNYKNLNESYLFSTIAKKVNDFAMKNDIPKGIEGLTEWNKNKRWIKRQNKKNK